MQEDLTYRALLKFSEENVKEAHNNGLHLRADARAVFVFVLHHAAYKACTVLNVRLCGDTAISRH